MRNASSVQSDCTYWWWRVLRSLRNRPLSVSVPRSRGQLHGLHLDLTLELRSSWNCGYSLTNFVLEGPLTKKNNNKRMKWFCKCLCEWQWGFLFYFLPSSPCGRTLGHFPGTQVIQTAAWTSTQYLSTDHPVLWSHPQPIEISSSPNWIWPTSNTATTHIKKLLSI